MTLLAWFILRRAAGSPWQFFRHGSGMLNGFLPDAAPALVQSGNMLALRQSQHNSKCKDALREIVEGLGMMFGKARKLRGVIGTFNPSLWKWYHRHGYWARRKKNIHFDDNCKWRGFQMKEGPGKSQIGYVRRYASWWQDTSYYKPLKNWCKF